MRNVRKDPYAICEQRRPRWACASVQSALDSLCSSTYTTIYIDSVSGTCKPRSACANAQADLGLRCPPLHKDLFRILRIIRNTFDTIGMLCFVITDFAGSLFFLLFVKWISLMFSLRCRLRSLRNLYISLSVRKRTFGHVRPAKVQISLRICTVWSESSLDAFWIAKDAKFLHADNSDSDQTARMRSLIWDFVGRMSEGTVLTLRLLW